MRTAVVRHWILAGALFFGLEFTASGAAEPSSKSPTGRSPEETRPSAARPVFWKDPSYPQAPEFMRHWEFGINVDEDERPRYFADLIFPLYRNPTEDRTVFVEPVLHHAEAETLLNLGLGHRQLLLGNRWLLGQNLFYDYESQYSHARVGGGLEAISAYAEFRANGYFGISGERIVQESDAARNVAEAVDGYDLEFGAPVPYYSRLKLFGGYEWYNFKRFQNREGWWLRAEYRT